MIKTIQAALSLPRIMMIFVVVVAYIIFQSQVDTALLDFVLDVAFTRPPIRIAAVILTAISSFSILKGIVAIARHHNWFAWRAAFRQVGGRWFVITGLLMVLLVIKPDFLGFLFDVEGIAIVQNIIPLLMAIHTATIFAPDDEPALEIQLVAPRPMSWLIG